MESVPKWHTLGSQIEPREDNHVFSGSHPRGNRHNAGFDVLLKGPVANRSCQHAHPNLVIRPPVKLRVLCKRSNASSCLDGLWPQHAGASFSLALLGQHQPHRKKVGRSLSLVRSATICLIRA